MNRSYSVVNQVGSLLLCRTDVRQGVHRVVPFPGSVINDRLYYIRGLS